MNAKARATLIVISALLGSLLSLAVMPGLLDWTFQQLTAANSPHSSTEAVPALQNPPDRTPSRLGPEVSPIPQNYPLARAPQTLLALALLGLIMGAAMGTLVVRGLERVSTNWDRMATADKVTLFVGIFFGVVVSMPFLFIFQGLGGVPAPIITVALMVGLSAAVVYALRSMEEALPWYGVGGGAKKRKTGIKVLDTNVLIDGRVYDLVRTGFIEGEIYIPGFVLTELQHIADSQDSLKRVRGRRGLDIVKRMQAEFTLSVGNYDRYAPDPKEEVDGRLVRIAKAVGGDLVSNDFNLNRVATVQDVKVLNINELALALRPEVLPGESLEVHVVREGNQFGQGVGYLDDGTMVVVEHGRDLIGQESVVTVTQVIQTERGKMIFADARGMGEETEEPGYRKRPRGQK